jgi:outer membrane protein TolC
MKRLFLFVVTGLAAIYAAAQVPMTFEECLREAANNNPDLYIAHENLDLARTALWRSYTLFIPGLQANFSYNRGNSQLETGYQTSDLWDAGLAGDFTVFNGFRDLATLRQSRSSFTQSELSYQQARADLVYNLKKAFFSLLQSQDAYVLAEKIFQLRKTNIELIRMKYESGTEDKGSLMLSEAEYSQAEQAILEAKRAISNAQRDLNTVLGKHESVKITVTGTWDIVSPPAAPDFDELVKQTPRYRQQKISPEIAREGVRQAWGAFYPSLSVNYSIDAMEDKGSYVPLGNIWNIGTAVGYSPIDLHASDYLALRDAKTQLRQAEAAFLNQVNQLTASLETAFNNWQDAITNYKIALMTYEAQQTRLEINRIKYQNGAISFNDWNITQNGFINAQNSLLNAKYRATMSFAAWEDALGIASLLK